MPTRSSYRVRWRQNLKRPVCNLVSLIAFYRSLPTYWILIHQSFSLLLKLNLLCLILCPLPLVMSLGNTENSSILSAPSLQVFVHLDKTHPDLLRVHSDPWDMLDTGGASTDF